MQSTRKTACLLLAVMLITVLFLVGCQQETPNSQNSTFFDNTASTNGSIGSLSNNFSDSSYAISSENSALSSSAASSSPNTPTHTHTKIEIPERAYLKTAATLSSPSEFYYACDECGEALEESYTYLDALGYDYNGISDYIYALMKGSTPQQNLWNTEKNGAGGWNYIDGCMMIAFWELYNHTKNEEYGNFVKEYIDYHTASASVAGQLDNVNMGRVLFDLYDETGNTSYRATAQKINTQLNSLQRDPVNGCYWHKTNYPNQLWLDGVFMAQVFALRYAQYFGEQNYSDIMKHVRTVETKMKDAATGLYYHGYDSTKTVFWADKTTGLSKSFWLRATGWYFAALADLIRYMPHDAPEREELAGYLKNAVDSVLNYLDPNGNMFYQVVDKLPTSQSYTDNYLETSGTALICYSILRAVNVGALPTSYATIGKKIFNGICSNYLTINLNTQSLVLGGICKVAGLGGTLNRDGSYEYYMSESVVENEAKGVAPFILAYIQLQQVYFI